MKALFAHFTLARASILVSITGSVLLTLAGFARSQEVAGLRLAFVEQIPEVMGEIQTLSMINTKLHGDIERDEFRRMGSPAAYVRFYADHPKVEVGDVIITLSSVGGAGGVTDHRIRIQPHDRKRGFTKSQIAAFAYHLEQGSSVIRVTDIEYHLLGKGIGPDTIPADSWTFELTIVNRVGG